jgi:hypothetical protein
MSDQQTNTRVTDNRRRERRSLTGRVQMRFQTDALQGSGDNISSAGVLFFTEDAIRVVVEVEEDGELRSYPGRLIRTERMSASNLGIAVEFDED